MRYYDWLVAGILVAACALAAVFFWPLDLAKWIGMGCVLALVIVRAAWARRERDEHPPHEDIDKPWWKSRVRMWNDWKDWKRRY